MDKSFFNDPSSAEAIPEPLRDKHFILDGRLCLDLSHVTWEVLEKLSIEVYMVPKKFSLRNVNFLRYEEAPVPHEDYEEIQVTDDPFDNLKPLHSILLPPLKPEMLEKGRTTSILEIIRSFANSGRRTYLTVEGLAKSGKTMICQVLIPMIMSKEQATKDYLYMYTDLEPLRDDDYSVFCSNWINYIKNVWTPKALPSRDFGFANFSSSSKCLNSVCYTISPILGPNCKLVLVLDNMQYMLEHVERYSCHIQTFLRILEAKRPRI